ncbi:MAG: hypothetical protein AAGI30_01860 [Planctomycetota bacterium]
MRDDHADHPLDAFRTTSLGIEFSEDERASLIARTISTVAAQSHLTTALQLTPESGRAFDALVESGWSDTGSVPVLAAIAPPLEVESSESLVGTTVDRIEGPLRFEPGVDDGDQLGRSWAVARIGGIAAAVLLGIVVLNPSLNTGGEGQVTGGLAPSVTSEEHQVPAGASEADAADKAEIEPAARIRFRLPGE